MKKRIVEKRIDKKKGKYFYGINTDLNWGLKGLFASLMLILFIVIILLLVCLYLKKDFSDVGSIIFRMPVQEDYLAIFAGFLIFIAIPFFIGVCVGLNLRKKKRFK